MNKNCYVTGQPTAIPYTFGKKLVLSLTQEAYAHFIIRSSKHPTYQQIKKDLEAVRIKLQALENKHILCPSHSPDHLDKLPDDTYLDVAIEMSMLEDKGQGHMTQLAETSTIIFRAMRDEYRKLGKLTS